MSLGLDPDAFWRKTPRYIALILEGKSDQLHREHNERAWAVYHIAVLSRTKKIPDLRKLLARDRSARVEQTPEQQWRAFQMLAAAQKRS